MSILSSVGAGLGGVGFPTPPTAESPVSRIQQNPGPCMASGVGFPAPLMETSDNLSSPVSSEILALTQLPQNSVSSQSPDFVAISRDFTKSSKKCSPDELSVLELRGAGFTPHKKSTGFLAAHGQNRAQISGPETLTARATEVAPSWAGRTLRVLSVFSGQEHVPKIQEGPSLLHGSPLVQVKEVDVTALGLNMVKHWHAQAEEMLFAIQHQSFDLVFIALPSKGMSRTLFANKLGPSPLRSKSYPYGCPCLSQHSKRVNDAVSIEAAFMLALALATLDAKQDSVSSLGGRRTWQSIFR